MTRGHDGSRATLGAAWDGRGVEFFVASLHATRVEVCLFDAGASHERERVTLFQESPGAWRARVNGIGPGQLYGLRVHGPWDPGRGHLFDPMRLLLDPRAQAISGDVRWHPALGSDAPPGTDTAPHVPRCVVVDPRFDWGDDRPPRTPWDRTLIYEAHVRGLTMLNPRVPERLRGTYLGVACEPVIEHLLSLGVTAIELMPVAQFASERRLQERGATNYWGYNPVSFAAAHAAFAAAPAAATREFQAMVKSLHAAGIEVLVDACLGHTAEGAADGMTLSLRGIDNASYYRLEPDGRPTDWTGCGNTIDASEPIALGLVLDALRYWATVMHVDGFRLDQAVVLGRVFEGEFSAHAPFFAAIAGDPALRDLKWIAEPWDLGPGGYRLGELPAPFVEWNDRYRGGVRSGWRGDPVLLELATRLAGSSDVLGAKGPLAGIDFVACHDGFTLHDLVSYRSKHNEANGEGNGDGSDDNRSCNWGVEGATADRRVRRRRERAKRNLLATLALSQGVPMLAHGDELSRTQAGNNNAYCHDNELTWLNWDLDADRQALLDFARRAFMLRRDHAMLRSESFLRGEPAAAGDPKDVTWLRPDGVEMKGEDWAHHDLRALGMLLAGIDACLLVLVNTAMRRTRFGLPGMPRAGTWSSLLDTSRRVPRAIAGDRVSVSPLALVVLEWKPA